MNRRDLLAAASAAAALSTTTAISANARAAGGGASVGAAGAPHVATNTYPWGTFAKRAGEKFDQYSDPLLADVAATGITGYEPAIGRPAELDGLAERLARHGLEMRSIYVNSLLHDEAKSQASIDEAVAIAELARPLGARIVVTNPSPIRWGGPEDKTDRQLEHQARSLDRLGERLGGLGMTLAYHNHDSELRRGAREFHHMLTATDPRHVKFCLDAHWVYRGCGNSQVALFDAVAMYAPRIVELHLRQSRDGVWTEAFALEGDVDYRRLFADLDRRGLAPHLVLEQAVEAGSPQTTTVVEAHRTGAANLRAYWG